MAGPGTGASSQRLWLDLATPPQVLYFTPIVAELRARGLEVVVTARDFGSTRKLIEARDYSATFIGAGTGRRRAGKLLKTMHRSASLSLWAAGRKIGLALSYNSYAQAVAAAACRIPFVTSMDYEFQPANRVGFRLASRILVPEGFDTSVIASDRVRSRVRRHPGLKEHVYLRDWPLDVSAARDALGIPPGEPYFLVRSPADYALYHGFENHLLGDLVRALASVQDAWVVLMTRTDSQWSELSARFRSRPSVLLPRTPVDGPSAVAGAAAVVSAGGTMAREAAVLGVPAFSIFLGQEPGVDSWLVSEGRLTRLASTDDVHAVDWAGLAASTASRTPWVVGDARSTVVSALLEEVANLGG